MRREPRFTTQRPCTEDIGTKVCGSTRHRYFRSYTFRNRAIEFFAHQRSQCLCAAVQWLDWLSNAHVRMSKPLTVSPRVTHDSNSFKIRNRAIFRAAALVSSLLSPQGARAAFKNYIVAKGGHSHCHHGRLMVKAASNLKNRHFSRAHAYRAALLNRKGQCLLSRSLPFSPRRLANEAHLLPKQFPARQSRPVCAVFPCKLGPDFPNAPQMYLCSSQW